LRKASSVKGFLGITGNNRVVEVPGNRTTNTYGAQTVGIDLVDPRGIALDAMGNVYLADTGNNRVVKIRPDGACHRDSDM
jgi:DNA-binding beta-propeller fold protein YncE